MIKVTPEIRCKLEQRYGYHYLYLLKEEFGIEFILNKDDGYYYLLTNNIDFVIVNSN